MSLVKVHFIPAEQEEDLRDEHVRQIRKPKHKKTHPSGQQMAAWLMEGSAPSERFQAFRIRYCAVSSTVVASGDSSVVKTCTRKYHSSRSTYLFLYQVIKCCCRTIFHRAKEGK